MKISRILKLVFITLVIFFLFTLILPVVLEVIRQSNLNQCVSNLKQIGAAAETYRKQFGAFPAERGEAWHVKLIDTVCGKDNSFFQCPMEGTWSKTGSDYRGPAKDLNVSADYPRITLPIAADKCPGGRTQHFSENNKYGVSALTKEYQVVILQASDARWEIFGPESPYLKD